jgi:hypothetical protein
MSTEKKQIQVREGEGIADLRICSLERYFPDDLEGECDQCHMPIFYNPVPPFLCKKLCWKCAAPLLKNPDTELVCPPQTAAFLASQGVEIKVEEK